MNSNGRGGKKDRDSHSREHLNYQSESHRDGTGGGDYQPGDNSGTTRRFYRRGASDDSRDGGYVRGTQNQHNRENRSYQSESHRDGTGGGDYQPGDNSGTTRRFYRRGASDDSRDGGYVRGTQNQQNRENRSYQSQSHRDGTGGGDYQPVDNSGTTRRVYRRGASDDSRNGGYVRGTQNQHNRENRSYQSQSHRDGTGGGDYQPVDNSGTTRRVYRRGASDDSRDGGYVRGTQLHHNRENRSYQSQSHRDGTRGGDYQLEDNSGTNRRGFRDNSRKDFRGGGHMRGTHDDGNRGKHVKQGGPSHFIVNSIDIPKPEVPTYDKVEFVKRPGRSTCMRKIMVDTNFYQLNFKKEFKIYQYDMHLNKVVKPGSASTTIKTVKEVANTDRPLQKTVYKEVLTKFFEMVLPEYARLYMHDGMHNFYTLKQLPLPNYGYEDHEFELNEQETFDIKVKQVAIIDRSVLDDYNPRKDIADQRRTVLTVLDIYFKTCYGLNGSYVTYGPLLFDPKNGTKELLGNHANFNNGRELLFGKFISTRKVEGGVAIISDTTAAAFITFEGTAADFIQLKLSVNLNYGLSNRDFDMILKSLKGLQYTVDHFGYSKKFIIDGLSNTSIDKDLFEWTEKSGSKENHGEVSVTEYYMRKYNITLKYTKLPCITSRKDRKFPLELCKISPQKIPRSILTTSQEGLIVRYAAQPPSKKWEEIQKNVKELVSISAEIITAFKIEPELVPWKIEGVIYNSPKMLYANDQEANVDNGSWNLKEHQLRNVGKLRKWGVINFSTECVKQFIIMLQKIGTQMGVHMTDPVKTSEIKFNKGKLREIIEHEFNITETKSEFDLILFVLDPNEKQSYREIKRVCDTEMSIASQCIKDITVRKINDQICANLMLKINLRLKGINHILDNWDISVKVDENECMMIGADVTHPGEGDEIFCSIAAVVGSFDRELSQYGVELRAQKKNKIGGSTEEMIEHIGDMVKKLLVRFHNKNQKYPLKIIFYRDGVSEGQYSQVKFREINAILAMLKVLNQPNPTIKLTYVICGKRMRAKIKPHDEKDMKGRSGNVPAGTTIDSGIVDPIYFDFYQVAHEGIQGTSIPTHYFVLHDDNKLSANELQKLTFYLCHTYGCCTRSISTPAPARYAHDAAFRCRDISISKFEDSLKMVRKNNESIEEFEERKKRQVININETIQVPEDLSMFFI